MRRHFIAIFAIALALAAACSKEPVAQQEGREVRFNIVAEDTKALLTSDYHISWEAGIDAISLFSKNNNYRFDVMANGQKTWVEGTISETTSRYYAIYPYDASATNSTGFVTTSIPSEQKAVRNQFSNIIAVASTQTKELHFRNCVTLVEADLQTDGVTSISFKGNNGELIAGTVRISIPSNEETAPVTTVISGSKEVTVSNGGQVLQKGKYYLAIIPQTFSRGITITLEGPGGSAVRSTTASVTALRSRRLLTGTLDLKMVPSDMFFFDYTDGENSGSINPGGSRTLFYSYSGRTAITYCLPHANYKVEYLHDGLDTATAITTRLTPGISGVSGQFNLLPVMPTGGDNPANARLKSAASRGSRENPIDLSVDNNNTLGAGLSGVNTANCYIVRAPGWYSFPLVYGNAIKNGSANSGAYRPTASGDKMLSPFIDAYGKPISNPYISGAVDSRIEWQDVLGLIDDTVITRSDDIVFHISESTIREGNAVISTLNEHGRVLWSWHIWVTGASDQELKPVQITNKAGRTYNFMRINLGWVSPYSTPLVYPERKTKVRITENSTGKVIEFTLLQTGASLPANELGCSPFWQWGRKDPFVSSDGTLAKDDHDNYRKKIWYTTERRDTVGTRAALLGNSIDAFISNPSVYNITSGGDNQYVNAWNATQSKLGTADSIVKTVYDPCPPGYSLPPINAWSAFSTSNVSGEFNKGWYFWSKPGKTGETVFYPAAGSMSTSNSTSTSVFGSLRNIGDQCSYWSGNPNQANSAYYLSASMSSATITYGANRQYVYPIRPAKEQ